VHTAWRVQPETEAMSDPALSSLGPPEKYPWGDISSWKPLDTLVDDSLLSMEELGRQPDGIHRFRGEMKFAHQALMGPPGRLQGGLHCVARIFPLLRRISVHEHASTFPCRIYVRLEKGLPLHETVPYEANYFRSDGGVWWINSRFCGTDKLDAGAWSVGDNHLLDPTHWTAWRDRFAVASKNPSRQMSQVMATEYEHADDLFWTITDPGKVRMPGSMLRLFEAGEGYFSVAFICFYLDIIGALSKALEGYRPQFTTQVALEISQEKVPVGEPLIVIADRSSRRPAEHSRARPVEVNGELQGTTIVQTLLASRDFSKVYAHGWVATHPIDTKKIQKK